MFRSQKIRRQRRSASRQQHGARARRLRVELMEGRLMLAASALDAQTAADTTQPIWTLGQLGLTGAHITLQTQATDGGFVGYSHTDWSPDTAIDFNDTTTRGVSQSLPKTTLFGSSDYVVPTDTVNFGTIPRVSPIGDTGLDGAVIVADFDNGSTVTSLDMKPVVIGPNPSQPGPSSPGPNEGGSIPIHAIFADFRQDGHLASGVKSVSSLRTAASIDSMASARGSSKSDDAVVGEWARATVFEVAGGEPNELTSLGDKRTKTFDNSDVIPQNDPLSTIEKPHEPTDSRAANSSQAAAPDGQVGHEQPTQSADVILADSGASALAGTSHRSGADQVAESSALADSMQLAGTDLTGAASPESAAVEAVFRRLGEDKTAVVESNLHGKSWLYSIGTSPLLIALALERIAALNSRRARREWTTSPVKLAQQSPR